MFDDVQSLNCSHLLDGAAVAGGLAEGAVERDRGVGGARGAHCRRDEVEQRRQVPLAARLGPGTSTGTSNDNFRDCICYLPWQWRLLPEFELEQGMAAGEISLTQQSIRTKLAGCMLRFHLFEATLKTCFEYHMMSTS